MLQYQNLLIALLPKLLHELVFSGKIYTITDVKDLHDWMVSHISNHPLFRQLSEEEMQEDPVLQLLYNSTEEGKKVTRNAGDKFPAIFVRTENPPE